MAGIVICRLSPIGYWSRDPDDLRPLTIDHRPSTIVAQHTPHTVFITGGTGYLGAQLIRQLTKRGHSVRALVRQGSVSRLPSGAMPVVGDALHGLSYAAQVAPADTFVHLVGVSHPSPAKAEQFLTIDLASVAAAVPVAVTAGVKHFIYVSVAQPAPCDEGVRRRTGSRGAVDSGQRAQRHLPPSLVRARSRALVACPAVARLLAGGADSFSPADGEAHGPRLPSSDGASLGARRRAAGQWSSRH